MKILKDFILERLKITSKTPIKFGLTDFDIDDMHKYKLSEIKNLITNQNEKYSVKFILTDTNLQTLEITNFDVIPGLDKLKERYNIFHSDWINNTIIDINAIDNGTNPVSVKSDFLDLIDSSDDKILKLVFIDGKGEGSYHNQTKFYIICGYTNLAEFIVYSVVTDYSEKEIKIYVCRNSSYSAIKAKYQAQQTKNDYAFSADENYFNETNENDRQEDINSANIYPDIVLKDIPENKKYRKNGNALLFTKVYITLAIYGEMTKPEVLEKINSLTGSDLASTSYTTAFAEWKHQGKIKNNKNKLCPVPYKQWIVK